MTNLMKYLVVLAICILLVQLYSIYKLNYFNSNSKNNDIPFCKPIRNIIRKNKNVTLEQEFQSKEKYVIPRRKFITATFGMTGGIGNDLWKFASMYGIGRTLGREVYWENGVRTERIKELADIFPLLNELLHVKIPPPQQYQEITDFGLDCCKYEDPTRLKSIASTYLKLHKKNNNYFQSFNFFHEYENEIREIYQCGPGLFENVKTQAKFFFGSEEKSPNSHLMCVHTRRTDFFSDVLLGTDEYGKNFTNPAIDFVFNFLKKKDVKNISILVFGDDHKYMSEKIQTKHLDIHKYHIAKSQSRGEDICLANNFCDSMLLTASGSTFGWWMSYLMPKNSSIFYNSQVGDSGNFTKDIHDYDLFLPEWIKLTVENNKAKIEDRWWYERNGLKLDDVQKIVIPSP